MQTRVTHEKAIEDVGSLGDIPFARPVVVPVGPPLEAPHPMLLSERPAASAGWDVAVLILLGFAISVILQEVAGRYLGIEDLEDRRGLLLGLTMVRAVLIIGAVALIVRVRRQTAASVGWCGESWWATGLFGVVATVGAYAALVGTVGTMYVVYPSGFQALQRNPEKILAILPTLHPAVLCAVMLFVGFYEEIIFRGFLLTRLRRATGSATVAVLLSSAIFAGLHAGSQETAVVIPLFSVGVVWAVLTLWRRSVIPVIIGHGLFDLMQVMGLYLVQSN